MNAPDPQLLAKLRERAATVQSRVTLSSVVGADVRLVKAGAEWDGLCPFHADSKLGSFKVNDAKGIYKCFSCGADGDAIKYLMARKDMTFVQALNLLEADCGIDFRDAKQKAEFDRQRERRDRDEADKAEKRRLSAFGLWNHAARLPGTPAEAYLKGRGIDFARLGGEGRAIRYRHDCWNTELGHAIPAMVTAMVGPDGKHWATHRTYLELVNGRWGKARVDQPKMTLGKFMGAHIPLNKGKAGLMPLYRVPAGTVPAISEGIEDGLTFAMLCPDERVVAAATMENCGAIGLPDAVRGVTLIQQNDDAYRALRARQALARGDGEGAAHHERAAMQIDQVKNKVIAMHQAAGRTVDSVWPGPGFKDFNDELRGVAMEGV